MNEEGIKQAEFRLKKLREWKSRAEHLQKYRIGVNYNSKKAMQFHDSVDKQETIRALLYEDFEHLANSLIYDGDNDDSKLVNLMLSIFKECRR